MSLLNDHYLSSTNIFLSSDDADLTHSDSDKVFYLKKTLTIPEDTSLYIALTSFNMPYSFYMVRSGQNDRFDIETYEGGEFNLVTIVMPEGNYEDTTDIIEEINAQFVAHQGTLGTLFTLVENTRTNKFYLTMSVSITSVTISNILCWKILGFEKGATYNWGFPTTINFPKCFDLAGESCLHLVLKDTNIQNQNSKNIVGVLQRIPLNVSPCEYVYWLPTEFQYFETIASHINHLSIQILDENMEAIYLNGCIWKVGFTVHYKYKHDLIQYEVDDDFYDEEDIENQRKQIQENIEALQEQKRKLLKKKSIKKTNDNLNNG